MTIQPAIRKTFALMIFLVALPTAPSLVYAMDEQGPHSLLEKATSSLVKRIDQERTRLESEPEYAQVIVSEELEELVDFKRITRLVMARYFDTATREQKLRFLEVFKKGLIQTYASGITLYEGQDIRVLPPGDGDVQGQRARVKMEINANNGQVIPVSYSMIHKGDTWKVENVIVNGLNLGKTFRAQFDQSMRQYNGDLEQVIANWSSGLDEAAKERAQGSKDQENADEA